MAEKEAVAATVAMGEVAFLQSLVDKPAATVGEVDKGEVVAREAMRAVIGPP